jgi:formylglycine-generating enzyme required for sulfatase activity
MSDSATATYSQIDYEGGLERLKKHLGIKSRNREFETLELRLLEAIDEVRMFPSEDARSRRDKVIDSLSIFARGQDVDVSFTDLCRVQHYRQYAIDYLTTGVQKGSFKYLKLALENQFKLVTCEVPRNQQRGQTDEEKTRSFIESHILFLTEYEKLMQFKEQEDWVGLIEHYDKFAHRRHPSALPDLQNYMEWATQQQDFTKNCDEIDALIEGHFMLDALEKCRQQRETQNRRKKETQIVETLFQRLDELEAKALQHEAERALIEEDWFRAVRILRELSTKNQISNKLRREIRKKAQEYLIECFEKSLNMFPPEREHRSGVVSLDIAWSLSLPLPWPERAIDKIFRISLFPVTVWQYRQFVLQKGYGLDEYWTQYGKEWRIDESAVEPGDWKETDLHVDNQPVVGVSWYEAYAFCCWLTKQHRAWGWLSDNEEIRLPTKEEWRIAASRFPGTDKDKPWDRDVLFMRRNYEELSRNRPRPTPVGVFPENVSPCGAYDMAGNVWEWCSSGQREQREFENPDDDPDLISFGDLDFEPFYEEPDCCGGSFLSSNADASWEGNRQMKPHIRRADVGFRLCRSPKRK